MPWRRTTLIWFADGSAIRFSRTGGAFARHLSVAIPTSYSVFKRVVFIHRIAKAILQNLGLGIMDPHTRPKSE
jgi:hypothetical protein